ncbi:hypothetical protein [Thioclava sp. GXIMD2076]|uniref:hypothetical protein n=1 Tax=Thioclava sp. GXIMD2076 TaxID=3131931 RepID=UPI0030CAC4D1
MAQEPDLIISAGFSDAQLVKEADRIVAMYRKKGQDAQKAFQDAQGKVTDTAAARAHARELDRLSKAYDPVYRAASTYEKELRRLDRALDVGAISQDRYTEEVQQSAAQMQRVVAASKQTATATAGLSQSMRSTSTASNALNDGTKKVGGGMRNLRGQVQNTAFQFQDFVVQVQGGTSAVTAAAQQMPQLLGGFGALGAVLGLVFAIAIPVGAALFRLGRDSEDAAKKSEAFDKALGEARGSMGEFADAINVRAVGSIDDMIERFGRADEAIKGLMDRMRDAAKENAFEGFGVSVDEALKTLDGAEDRIAQIFSRLTSLRDEQNDAQSRLADLQSRPKINGRTVFGAQELTARLDLQDAQIELRALNDEVAKFGISPTQIEGFNAAWRALDGMLDEGNFTGAADQLEIIQSTLRATGNKELVDVANMLDQVTEQLREGAAEAGEVARKAEDISFAAQGISFDGAVQGAQTLADVLAEASRNMASLESSQAQQLARARIRRQYVGDKVGEAGALAGLEMDEIIPDGATLTDQQQADFDRRRAKYVSDAEDEARLDLERAEAERAAAEAARKSKSGMKSAEGEASKKQKALSGVFDGEQLTALQRQIELIGKSSTETARLRATWAAMDELKKAGIPLNDDLNAKIAKQADEVARLTGQLEQGEISQQNFDAAIDGVAGSLAGLITSGESVRDSLANIFRSIANDILQSGIKQALSSVMDSSGGGGVFGKILTTVFGGFRASGGPVSSNKAYVVGEKGPEMIVPRSAGTVIPNHALRSGGSSSNMSMTVDLRGTTGDVALDAKMRKMGQQVLQQVPAYMKNHDARTG